MTAADLAALTALGNVQGQLDWTTLMGIFTPGTPAANTPTLPYETAAGQFYNGPAAGQATLAAKLGALGLLAQTQGPKNAFTQQAVLHGLDANGLSNAIGSIRGQYDLPTFSAPNAMTPFSPSALTHAAQPLTGADPSQINTSMIGRGPVYTPLPQAAPQAVATTA